MEMKTIMISIIAITVGAILLGAMLPTALDSLYGTATATNNQAHGFDQNGKTIATDLNVTNDDATIAIWNLLPLFAVLGGMALLAGFAYTKIQG